MRNCSPVYPSNVLRRTPLYYNSDSFVCLYLLLYGGQLIYFFSFHLFLQRILNTWCTMCRLCSELSQHVRCCSTNSHNFFPPPNWCPILLLSLLPPKVTLPRGREPATSCPTFGSFLSLGQPQKLGRGNDASSAQFPCLSLALARQAITIQLSAGLSRCVWASSSLTLIRTRRPWVMSERMEGRSGIMS